MVEVDVNSMRSRVKPVFDALRRRSAPWLDMLLRLPSGGATPSLVTGRDAIEELRYGDDETGLPPPSELLQWLVTHLDDHTGLGLSGVSAETRRKREELLHGVEGTRDAPTRGPNGRTSVTPP